MNLDPPPVAECARVRRVGVAMFAAASTVEMLADEGGVSPAAAERLLEMVVALRWSGSKIVDESHDLAGRAGELQDAELASTELQWFAGCVARVFGEAQEDLKTIFGMAATLRASAVADDAPVLAQMDEALNEVRRMSASARVLS